MIAGDDGTRPDREHDLDVALAAHCRTKALDGKEEAPPEGSVPPCWCRESFVDPTLCLVT